MRNDSHPLTRSCRRGLWALLALAGACTAGTDTGNPNDNDGVYVSDSPIGELVGFGSATGTDLGGEDGSGDPPDAADPGRLIADADLIQRRGNILYALNAGTGLHVVDIAEPDRLERLGGYRVAGEAFEMLLDGDTALVTVNGFGRYVASEEEGAYLYEQSALLLALDVGDPAAIAERGRFEVPGRIREARRVGDVLYLVSIEDGYCWGCESAPSTTVTSLHLADLTQIAIADQLRFEADSYDFSYHHPVAISTERMYVGSDSWLPSEGARSTIQVIDISDPSGSLQPGAELAVAGAIQSRWQMDEHGGVLRVISQAQSGAAFVPPVLQTFAITSASEIAALGTLTLELPRPESLRSARFDGDRGYAVTFEQTDPLFTLDLSDPAAPVQRAELEIPGFIHHMEPRGDRLLALGFDRQHPDGALHVSLFDVADLANPVMLERVHFGGAGGAFGDSQDRLHQALGIHEAEGLLTIPMMSWGQSESVSECPGDMEQSGVQLVDFSEDSLDLRGNAPVVGAARRAFLQAGRLLSVSSEALQSFDIDDRDTPMETSRLRMSRNVYAFAIVGEHGARLSTDALSRMQDVLDVTALADIENPETLGELELSGLQPPSPKGLDSGPDSPACWYEWVDDANELVFTVGDYVLFGNFSYGELILSSFDVADAAAPRFVGHTMLPIGRGSGDLFALWSLPRQRMAVQVGSVLAFLEDEQVWEGDTLVSTTPVVSLVDIRDPEAPLLAERIELPASVGFGGLHVGDGQVLLTRAEALAGDGSKVKFFVERIDVADPAAPERLTPINVPGILLHQDAAHGRMVTLDVAYGDELEQDRCWETHSAILRGERCFELELAVSLLQLDGERALRLDRYAVEDGLSALGASDERLFVATSDFAGYGATGDIAFGFTGPVELPEHRLMTFDLGSDALEPASTQVLSGDYYLELHVKGSRFVSRLSDQVLVFDASDAAAPELRYEPIRGSYCYLADVREEAAYCVGGSAGVQVIDLAGP
ncbi:MAG: beta-propeller domain-containing protein [Myxococcales bacterium]|nr:beta-propeller domain-containing protein [Myxococcales bacterium]